MKQKCWAKNDELDGGRGGGGVVFVGFVGH